MSPVWLLAIGVFWGALLVFALGLARAAGKPTPKPERDEFDFDWPHPWTPQEVADASYRLGFEGGRAVQRIEDRRRAQ